MPDKAVDKDPGATPELWADGATIETWSPEETRAFGAAVASRLSAGDFVALDGDLASGKTCLVQGMAAGLGYQGRVTSPTFTLLHLYEGGRLPLYHFDVYRLKAPAELEGLGYEDYFYGDGVCVVEWSSLTEEYLPSRRVRLFLERIFDGDGGEGRRITLTCYA
ncbi:MAG: tRNA (adenosine(37)-N6)-threonylcarbamoyltransferase complex ATPase subunit type 1 TsaE [Peptococcaceae bacterium]|nr:tRNA (adenosine(37)-N6)-threonylcarbamoyltransferase complex ATPase subunit type 1 TsaE [Peptococcaceae bacterium]